jgi:hypothetical protein
MIRSESEAKQMQIDDSGNEKRSRQSRLSCAKPAALSSEHETPMYGRHNFLRISNEFYFLSLDF